MMGLPLTARRVLVVEDEALVQMLMEDMLIELGCTEMHAAASPEEAMALLERHTFDLATLDVNLNGQPSYPVADALARRGIPFVFATGYGHHLSEDYGSCPILQKPFRLEDLERQATRLLSTDAGTQPPPPG